MSRLFLYEKRRMLALGSGMFQQREDPLPAIAAEAGEPGRSWSLLRKLLAIMAASLVAWIVWGGAALLVWRALTS